MYGACLGLPFDYLAIKPKRLKWVIAALIGYFVGAAIIGPMTYDTMVLGQPWQFAFIPQDGKPVSFVNEPTIGNSTEQQNMTGVWIPRHVASGQLLPQWVAVLGQQSGKSVSPLVMTAGTWFPGKVVQVHARPQWTVPWNHLFREALIRTPQNIENWFGGTLADAWRAAVNEARNIENWVRSGLADVWRAAVNEARSEYSRRATL